MSVTKNQRVLIVINHIPSGETDYLYRFIEKSARATIDSTLGDDYARIVKLYGADATLPKLIAAIKAQGAISSVRRIDLIVMLHGSPGKLIFHDGPKNSSLVRDQIVALHLEPKLRFLYNTACYGDSHSVDFFAAGFDSVIGSQKVNANAAVEFTPLLFLWQFNNKLCDCLAPTVPPTPAADALARTHAQTMSLSWKNDVNSTKMLRGNRSLTIST